MALNTDSVVETGKSGDPLRLVFKHPVMPPNSKATRSALLRCIEEDVNAYCIDMRPCLHLTSPTIGLLIAFQKSAVNAGKRVGLVVTPQQREFFQDCSLDALWQCAGTVREVVRLLKETE